MNIYEKLGLNRVINASGRMTALGVSTISDSVAKSSIEGAQNYVVINDLYKKAGEIISTYTGAEDSLVTSCASSAIVMVLAGLITKGKMSLVEKIPNTDGLDNEVIILKGHCINYGVPINTMISLAGGKVIEAGSVNISTIKNVEELINDKTVCLLYVKSHHCVQKSMVSLEAMIEIAKKYNKPLVIDAAAEEDLKKYISLGADVVIYSGAKALEATTSGFATGKRIYIDYAKAQYYGIGRAMKVGKEQIIGLLKALDEYKNKDINKYIDYQKTQAKYLVEKLSEIDGINASIKQDEAGREIYRAQLKMDEKKLNISAIELANKLKNGNPEIHCRQHLLNEGIITFDTRSLVKGDKELIVLKVKKILEVVNG